MNLTRPFQLATMLAFLTALAGIYLNTRGHSELADAPPHATPNPSTPASTAKPLTATTSATAATFDASNIAIGIPAAMPPLPTTKASIVAELTRRGYKLEPLAPVQPIEHTTGYRVAGMPAAVAFTEHDGGTLTMVDVAVMASGSSTNGPPLLEFAEIVGEVSTGRSRDTTRQAIAQTMAALGKNPGRLSCSFGAGKDRFRLQVTRHDGGRGYSFAFAAE